MDKVEKCALTKIYIPMREKILKSLLFLEGTLFYSKKGEIKMTDKVLEALESLAKKEAEADEDIHNRLQELIELVNKINEKMIDDNTVSKSEKIKSIIF